MMKGQEKRSTHGLGHGRSFGKAVEIASVAEQSGSETPVAQRALDYQGELSVEKKFGLAPGTGGARSRQ
jgi:hypothetical protein